MELLKMSDGKDREKRLSGKKLRIRVGYTCPSFSHPQNEGAGGVSEGDE